MTAAVFREFDLFVEEGILRRLACVFARFLTTIGAESPALAIASAALSELEGRGHSCLQLSELASDPCLLLGWPGERWEALREAAGILPDDAEGWRQILAQCEQVWLAGSAEDKGQPLILDGYRLYLRRYWRHEQHVARAVAARAAQLRILDISQVRQWLDRLFQPVNGDSAPDWQKIACAIAVRSHLSIITGGPGTGKTYTVARLLALLFALAEDPRQLRIALAAPTGKAAARLKQSIDQALDALVAQVGDQLPLAELAQRMAPACTLHSLLGAHPDRRTVRRHHAGNPLEIDVLIVDEASMIDLEMMAALLQALPADATLILLGDKDQLASVEAGAVMGDLCHEADKFCYSKETLEYLLASSGQQILPPPIHAGDALAQQTVMLRHSRRFAGAVGTLAGAVNAGDAASACAVLRECASGELAWIEQARQPQLLELAVNGRPGAGGSYRHYLELLPQLMHADAAQRTALIRQILSAFDAFRILCAVRQGEWGVAGINQALEKHLEKSGMIKRGGEWYAGRPVMVMRNDYGVGVFNGDIGITLPDPARSGSLRVYFLDGETVRSVLATRLPAVETAFAMTVHKSQGSEFRHAALVLPPEMAPVIARELIYTGITRARESFTMVTPVTAVLAHAIAAKTRRASGLRALLEGSQQPTSD